MTTLDCRTVLKGAPTAGVAAFAGRFSVFVTQLCLALAKRRQLR